MDTLTFDTIAKAWKRLVNDPIKVDQMQTQAPSLINPEAIRLKRINEDEGGITIRFVGFDAASDSSQGIPTIKRMIQSWLKRVASEVRVIDSIEPDLTLLVSKDVRFTEAAVTIFRRDPKTNKIKRAYKCIGGRKDGRRVQNPDQCMQFPDVDKKMNLAITKRAKYGQSVNSRTKTKLTNIVSKRVRKANQRLKKARGI